MAQIKINDTNPDFGFRGVSMENGSATATVLGVDLTNQGLEAGDLFSIVGDTAVYQLASAPTLDGDDTLLSLSAPFAGGTGTFEAVIHRDFTDYGLPLLRYGDLQTPEIFSEAMRRLQELRNELGGAAFAELAEIGQALGVYADTATALADTTDGDYFYVISGEADELYILYENDSGSATELGRVPSAQALADLPPHPLTANKTIKVPTDHAQLDAAFAEAAGYASAGYEIEILMEAGFAPEAGIASPGGDWSHIVIRGEDAVHTAGAGFGASASLISAAAGHAPRLDCVVDMNAEGAAALDLGRAARGVIETGAEIRNAGGAGAVLGPAAVLVMRNNAKLTGAGGHGLDVGAGARAVIAGGEISGSTSDDVHLRAGGEVVADGLDTTNSAAGGEPAVADTNLSRFNLPGPAGVLWTASQATAVLHQSTGSADGVDGPTLAGNNTAGNHSYTTREMRWTRIGRMVFARIALKVNLWDAAADGVVKVLGLPFAPAADGGAVSFEVWGGIDSPGAMQGGPIGRLETTEGGRIILRYIGATGQVNLVASRFGDGSSVYLSCVYETDAA